jgi:crotonobetainyl-CoA:carnitine CoA-transferase CaiB-like acyl-CoA transferase
MVGAILGALRLAEKSGTGQVVETSLYEAAVWTQASDYAVTAVDHMPVRKRRRDELLTITGNRFPCGDGNWVVFNMLPDGAYWSRLCKAIGLDDIIEDERFIDSKARYRNMAALIAIFDEALATKSRDEWGKIFDDASLIWGPVMGLHEVPQDPHAQELGMFPSIEHPELGSYTTVNIPMRFATADVKPQGPAPQIGEHSEKILRDFGLTNDTIAALQDAGTVGQG